MNNELDTKHCFNSVKAKTLGFPIGEYGSHTCVGPSFLSIKGFGEFLDVVEFGCVVGLAGFVYQFEHNSIIGYFCFVVKVFLWVIVG